MGRKATKEDVITTGSLDRFISNSNDPSNTINMSPIVPKTGSTIAKSGIEMSQKIANCFTPQPNMMSNITEGIFVFEELMSKI